MFNSHVVSGTKDPLTTESENAVFYFFCLAVLRWTLHVDLQR
jgi:hypothetical protein